MLMVKHPPPRAYILSFSSHLHLNVNNFRTGMRKVKKKKNETTK